MNTSETSVHSNHGCIYGTGDGPAMVACGSESAGVEDAERVEGASPVHYSPSHLPDPPRTASQAGSCKSSAGGLKSQVIQTGRGNDEGRTIETEQRFRVGAEFDIDNNREWNSNEPVLEVAASESDLDTYTQNTEHTELTDLEYTYTDNTEYTEHKENTESTSDICVSTLSTISTLGRTDEEVINTVLTGTEAAIIKILEANSIDTYTEPAATQSQIFEENNDLITLANKPHIDETINTVPEVKSKVELNNTANEIKDTKNVAIVTRDETTAARDVTIAARESVSEPAPRDRESADRDDKMTKTVSDTSDLRGARRKCDPRGPGHVSHQFFHVEPCLYTHRMFQRAAVIFSVLKDNDTATEETKAQRRRQGIVAPTTQEKIPDMEFIDAHEQIKTFELAFATLKYQKLFQEILDRTIFFQENNDLRDAYSLVCIILYDLQSRKFQRRIPLKGEVPDSLCYKVEEALLSRKTRLLSTIAKERIRHGAPSLEFLLPEQVRHKDETKSRIPVYTWVNQIKLSMEEYLEELRERGFTMVEDDQDMSEATGRVYRVDHHCPDLVVFPPSLAMYFKDSHWVKDGSLVQQDKSSCLAPHTVMNILTTDQDVIHVNVGTGMSTGHMASLIHQESAKSHFWGFGVDTPDKARKVVKNLDMLGVKNTKILQEDFLSVDPEDYRFRNVRIIFITANCSKSAITSPVQFIVSEGEDMQILGELSKAESNMAHVGSLAKKHERQLKHALRFPKLQAVVYSTRSRYEAENESVISRAVEFVNQTSGKKLPFKVSPPVIPFSADEIGSGSSGVDGRYIRFRPTDKANGCFVAIISREPEEPKDTGSSKSRKTGDETADGKRKRKGKKKQGSLSTRTTASLPEVTSRQAQADAVKKSQSARVYQATILAKMKSAKSEPAPTTPGGVKIVRHPAPFSKAVDATT